VQSSKRVKVACLFIAILCLMACLKVQYVMEQVLQVLYKKISPDHAFHAELVTFIYY
jgi:hypothetical protein